MVDGNGCNGNKSWGNIWLICVFGKIILFDDDNISSIIVYEDFCIPNSSLLASIIIFIFDTKYIYNINFCLNKFI